MSNFNLKDYGAKGDGKTLDTKAIQKAIDTCHSAGGGTVLCEGGTYLTGSINLKSNVELHLARGSRILGSPNIKDYSSLKSPRLINKNAPEGVSLYLVGASHAENIAITGTGEIDANGLAFYNTEEIGSHGKFAEIPEKRPRAVMFHKCKDIRIIDSAFINSPCWTFWLMMCEKIHIQRITIEGDFRMHNNDGIDIDSCRDVTISDCNIKTDDDCLILRAIQGLYEEEAICENILVTNCNLSSTCQGIRIGCPTDHIIRNAVFNNLTIKSTKNGINSEFPTRYLKESCKEGCDNRADVSNIMVSNCVIDCNWHPIRIMVDEGINLRRLSGFSFSNMKITCKRPLLISGEKHTTIRDISFNNIEMNFSCDQAFEINDCENLRFNNFTTTKIFQKP